MERRQLSSLSSLRGAPGVSTVPVSCSELPGHLSTAEAAQLMSCRHYAGNQQAEVASNFSYNSINNSHSYTSSFCASCDSSVQQHISDSSGYHNSEDTMGCFSSSGNWQCEGDLTLADILNMSVPGGLQPQEVPLGGQAVGQMHGCQPSWGPQQAAEVSRVGTLPQPAETMASFQRLQQHQATGLAAYNTAALNRSRPGCLGGAAAEQQLLQQLMQQVESVTATGGFSVASDTIPAALGLDGGQTMLSALVPPANQPLAAAPAIGTSLAMSASEQLQLEWLQQRNALLQQQLVQQQELVQEQQRQQERLQQQLQLQLLLQQQQQQGTMQQPGNTTWPSDVDLLAAAFPDLNISSSNEHNRQAAATAPSDPVLLLQQLPANVGAATGTLPLVALDSSRGASSLSGLGTAFAAGPRSPDDAASMLGGLPGQPQVPYTMRVEQVVLQVVPEAPATATVAAVQPAAAPVSPLRPATVASYITPSTHQQQQQPAHQQQPTEHSSGGTQTVGTGVFIRGVAAGTVSAAGPTDTNRQQSTVALAAVQGPAGGCSSVSSSGKLPSQAGTGQAGAVGTSTSTSWPQTDHISKSRSFDGSSRITSPLTAAGPEVRRSNSSRGRHSFDSAKSTVKRPEGQQGSAGTPPAAGASSSQHSSDGSGSSVRRSLPGRPGKGHSPVRRCAPKWAPQNWDPKAQVAELGASSHKGTGAFIPGAMRSTTSTGALDQAGAKGPAPAVDLPPGSTTAPNA